MLWIVVALQLSSSYAQLTPPGAAVCVTNQVVFVCQQTGSGSRWTLGNLPRGISNELSRTVSSSQAGAVSTFPDDPGFGFEIHILSSSSASSVISELRVTAVRELNGVTVECVGNRGRFMSTIQIASVDPPAAPSGVMTTADQSQFTPSTASITLTWSASSGADNYTIMVTPLLPSGHFLVPTTTTSLQLTVLYNEEYSINITAQNCAGSNSTTIVPLTVVGCCPPSPLANGSISEYSSGAVGAMLTFQCDTGYIPQEEVTSTCQPNSSWVPTPECEVIDCGTPTNASGVIIDPFNFTKFGALITFHCEESNNSMTTLCGSDGEWFPDPTSYNCDCGVPSVGATGVIIEPFNNTKFGALITFHCEESNISMTTVCGSDGEWDPDPASTNCNSSMSNDDPTHKYMMKSDHDLVPTPVGLFVGISVAVLFLVIMLTAIIIAVVMIKKKQDIRKKTQSFTLETYNDSNDEDGQHYAHTRHLGPRAKNETGEEEYSILNHNVHVHELPSGRGDTLIYADLGPSSGKRCTPVTSNIQDDHRVVYSTVNHALQQMTKKSKIDKTGPCVADVALDLDMLLIQLKPQVLTKWKQFAEAVGLSNIIKELSQYSEDECIVEVFDQWLKSHPTKPTWRNVADVLNDIGLQQLANDILKVYQTGNLPLVVDMDAVPEMTTSDTETPPPLPPKIEDDALGYTNSTSKTCIV